MSNCTYRFTGPDGKEVTIVGKAEMQAYMAANLDFFSAKGNFNFQSKSQLEVTAPEPAGAKAAPAEDLDAMFDEVLSEEVGAKQEKPKRKAVTVSKAGAGAAAIVIDPSAMGGAPNPRTAGQAAASAAKNTAAGLGDTIAALGKLFGGGGKLSSGLTFDEQTYAKAKPLFKQAIAHFRDAGQDIKEAMRAVVRMVLDQFGAETAQNMKPYVVRFMEDVRDGKINYDEGKGGEDGSNDEQRGSTGEQGDAALGGVPAGENGRPEGSRYVRDAGQAGRRAGDGGNPGADAQRGDRGRSRGDGAAGVHPAEARAEAGVSPAEAPSAIPAANFRITEDVRLGKGGEFEKYNDNLRAIQIVKTLEAERRRATPEEQVALARYVGWGGLPSAFRNRTTGEAKKGWESRVEALEKLLTKDELDAARRSTMDAHYTAQPVVEAMWKAAQRLGFAGGVVLEPSVGVGNFIGLTPWKLEGNTRFVGVEYDGITARIARALYPQSSVLHSGFQDIPLQPDGFDLAIGNPPFGGQSLYFPYSENINGMSIHNQFFVASMDAVKPGGLQVMVVSRYLMDAKDSKARRMLAEKADLLGAIRLPDSAFQENARTEVVTDILFLKKREVPLGGGNEDRFDAAGKKLPPVKVDMPAWVETTEVADPLGGAPIEVNRYFAENPQMMLGSLERSGSMRYENDVTLRANPGEDIREALETAISRLPELPPQHHDAVSASLAQFQAMREALEMSVNGEEEGAIKFDEDGNLVQVVSRESAGSADMLARRVLTPESPWSPQIQMDNEGRWFRVSPKLDEDGNKVKNGRFVVYDRETFASDKDVPESLRLGAGKFERLKALAGLRDLLKKQLNLESADEAADVMEENRSALDAAYKAFVKAHGFINAGPNQALLSNMPDGPLVSALEMKYDPGVTAARARRTGQKVRKESAEPAPIMSQRVVLPYVPPNKAETGAEALTISLSETGRVDLERMAALLGKSEQGVIDELFTEAESPLIFRDPETGEWQTRDAYLSGQVVKKLAAARDAGLEKNAAALEAVQPPPLGAADISIRLGQSWVPTDIYAEFVQKIVGGKSAVHFSKAMNQFDVSGQVSNAAQAEWGTERASPLALIESMMNSRAIAIYDYFKEEGKDKRVLNEEETQLANAKATEIANEFADWIMADADRRSRLVEIYNREFNNRVVRQYDGSHMILPGKVPDAVVKLRRHQKNVIWRGVSERNLLIDHAVGAGKSYAAIARAMERRRMGLAKKPVIVVPNHMVEQFSSDVYRLYPGARVLAAGKKDFEAKKRRRLFSKIATGDWDIVVVPHSSFKFIGVSPEREAQFIQEEIAAIEAGIKEAEAEDAGDGWRKPQSVKDGERLLERLNERMKRIKDIKRDNLLTFEQLGIDDMTIDEAHMFKNLAYYTRLTKVLGLGSKEGSERAWDLYNKVRVLRESPRGAVTFMTGTPISNSIVEMYTMMRYLAMDELKDLGLEHFDAWHKQFAEAVTKFELNDANQLAEKTRLARWSNMPELMKLYYSFTDAVSLDDIKRWYAEDNGGKRFPVPAVKGGKRNNIIVQPTPAQESILEDVVAEFNGLKEIKDPRERNKARLRLMDRARKVSLDARAVDPRIPTTEPGGKLEKVADEVARIYKEWASDKGTQLVFLDRSVPKSKGDDKFLKMYDALVARKEEALRAGDEDLYDSVQEELDKFNPAEVQAVREAQSGGWNAYEQIKRNLMARGLPENEIRFIQEANTDDQKQQLFDAVKAGEVRVLLGSTERMGAGTNVQDRLVALHHVDVNWKPSDIEQREGRIVRQGNLLLEKYGEEFEVELNAYATERTYDAKMWSLNEAKGRFINGLRSYNGEREVEIDDSESENMAEMAAMASGDPRMLERVQLDAEVKKLELARRSFNRRKFTLEDSIQRAERAIATLPAKIEGAKQDQKRVNDAIDEAEQELASRRVDIEGEEFETEFEAQRKARELIDAQKGENARAKFTLMVNGRPYTSVDAVEKAIRGSLGDATAFPFEMEGGERFNRRAVAASAVSARMNDMLDEGKEEEAIGTFYGLQIRAFVSRESGEVHGTLFVQGESVKEARDVRTSETGQFNGENVQNSMATLARDIRESVNVPSMQRQLSDAQETLPVLKEQLGKPFAQAEEYEKKKARLSELTSELAAEGKDNAPTALMRGEAGDGSISRDEAERIINEFRKQYPAAPMTMLVERFEDLPEQARREAEMQGGNASNTFGAMHQGAMYLIRGNLSDREALETAVFHELVGHFGLRNLLGPDFVRKTNQLYAQLGGVDGLRRLAEKEGFTAQFNDYAKNLVGAYQKNPEVFTEEFVKMLLTEEAFAHIAQNRPTIATHIKALVGMIRDFLRSLGFFKGKELNQYDVAHILTQVRSKLSAGGGVMLNGDQKPMAKMQARETVDVDGVERPTTNSKGQPIHPTAEGVRKFWEWFGDSKVVDSQGRPLVVYHGTADDIAAFKIGPKKKVGHGKQMPGIYFSPLATTAAGYARSAANAKDASTEINNANIVPAYVSIQNSAEFTDPEDFAKASRAKLEAAGRDGAFRRNAQGDVVEIVAFEPEQIKSAIGNSGAFDPANPSILASRQSERTTETPASIRSALVERFGEEGIAALEGGGLLKIVPSMDAVPADVRIDGAEAVYDPAAGVAYLVADRMSPNRAAAALLHELGEHHGLEGFIGKPAWMLLKARVAAMAQRAGSYASGAWAGVKATYPEFEGMADADLAKNDRFIHEVLAKIGESGSERRSSLWSDLVSAIKRGMLRLGFSFQINEDDVRDLVAGSLRRLMRGGDGGPRGGLPLAQMVWHGSPHKFDKFSTDAIGTGEGAQAYGWGLYFAGKKDVAEWYKNKLSEEAFGAETIKIDGVKYEPSVLLRMASDNPESPDSDVWLVAAMLSARKSKQSDLDSLIKSAPNERTKAALQAFKDRGEILAGALYQVEIPEEGEYLLWDKPLSEQPEKVREALNLSRWQEFAFRKDGTPRNLSGQDLYRAVAEELGSDKEASLALHEAGVAGIKYLDGTSRNAGEGSYNYVVFDDSRVSIQAMASRAFNPADFIRSPEVGQQIRNKVSDLFRSGRTFNILHRTVGTQYHKAKVDPQHFGRVFNMAQQYIDDISRTANEAADVAPDLLPKMERMADAFKQLWHARADAKDAQALAAPIFEGTMSDKVWSDAELRQQYSLDDRQIGLYQQFRAAVDRSLDELALSEMSRTAKMAKLQPAPREMNLRDALAFYMEQIEPDIEQIQGELAEMKARQKFEREQLEEAAQNGDSGADERRRYADLLESMKSRHAAESEALKVRIEDMAELLKATQGKVEQIEHLKATGYAPLMRFGQYTVDVFDAGEDGKPLKNADGEEIRHFFGMFENESEANEAARALREEYPNATINQGVMSQDSFRLFRGVTPETVEVFARMMGEEQSEVFQKYLKQAVNNRSALKRLIQRKGIAGFEKDPVRVLATFLTSNARATAANYHFGDMLRAASEIPKEKGDVKDEAIKLIDYIQNPGDEAASLRGLLFMHFLGGSVASAMVNMTQTFTMTLPYLAQFGGDVAGNLKEAMGIAGRRLFNKNAEVPEELKMALQRASDEGVVSPHEIHMLQGESMRTGWFQNNRYMRAIGKVWGSFFSLAEHFNRDVAFIAAYRSALQRNLSDEQAYEFAKDAVRETQGVYCVDTDTEILTAAGWKRFDQLEVGEQVFTVDMDGNLVHDALKNVHVFDGQHEVTEFRNANGFSMVVTDDHRNMVQNYNSRDKKWQRIRAVKTRDLKSGHFLLRAPLGDATGREQVYSDDQVRLMAWVAAEGHFFAHRNVKEKRGVGIVQSDNHNPMYVEEIDELLARLGGHFNRKVGKDYRKMVCWQLRKPLWMFIHEALPQKRVTMDLLSKLTVPQMRIFLETFTKADGTIPDVGGSSIGQKSVETLNTLQAMAVLSGQTSTLCERQKNLIEGGFRDYGSLYLAKNSIRAYLKECTKERRVVDTVWCPETHSGTWIARRNGRTFITGNSRANKPNWARGAVGATIFTFKQFSISYLEFLRRLPSRERAIALAVLWVFAGAAGMPFSDDLDDLIDTIAHMLGFAWDNKAKKRAFVANVFGRDASEFIMNGVSAGLPLDISGRMGMANLIPGTGVLDPSKDRAKELSEIAGPAGSAIQTIVKAGDRMLNGIGSTRDVRDIAAMAAPIAIANLMKGWDMAEEGFYSDSRGRKVVDTDLGDAFSKALGFNPSAVSQSSRAREEIFNRSAVVRDVKNRISERWALGIAHGRPDQVMEARKVLAHWNENNPDDPIRVNMSGILRRAKEARATAADRAIKATPKELRDTARMIVDGSD